MSLLLWTRVDTALLHPRFLSRAMGMLDEEMANHREYWVVSGYRDQLTEQAALYAQGRTTPGPIVTNAKPFQSWHGFGVAIDVCRDKYVERAGLQPDYSDDAYSPLDRACRMYDLESGLWWRFKDPPHIQLPGLDNQLLAECAALWKSLPPNVSLASRLAAVWQLIDAHTEDAHA